MLAGVCKAAPVIVYPLRSRGVDASSSLSGRRAQCCITEQIRVDTEAELYVGQGAGRVFASSSNILGRKCKHGRLPDHIVFSSSASSPPWPMGSASEWWLASPHIITCWTSVSPFSALMETNCPVSPELCPGAIFWSQNMQTFQYKRSVVGHHMESSQDVWYVSDLPFCGGGLSEFQQTPKHLNCLFGFCRETLNLQDWFLLIYLLFKKRKKKH